MSQYRSGCDADAPEVSIIILNFNKSALTKICLEKLGHFTKRHRYEIILVDNGSDVADFTALHKFRSNFTLLRSEERLSFAKANNIGAERARGRFIVFLNN